MLHVQKKQPIHGQPFADVLGELYAHALTGAPGESDPFTLPLLHRECMAYGLAVYYQCEHCQTHHQREILKAQKTHPGVHFGWESRIIDTVLYARFDKMTISSLEWVRWEFNWSKFVSRLDPVYADIAHLVLFTIAAARDDKGLMQLEARQLAERYTNEHELCNVMRDVMRVMGFMKAATSINRIIPDLTAIATSCRT